MYAAKIYRFRRNEHVFGPFSAQALRRLADEKKIVPTDLINADGSQMWVRAEQVCGLFSRPAQPLSKPANATAVAPPVVNGQPEFSPAVIFPPADPGQPAAPSSVPCSAPPSTEVVVAQPTNVPTVPCEPPAAGSVPSNVATVVATPSRPGMQQLLISLLVLVFGALSACVLVLVWMVAQSSTSDDRYKFEMSEAQNEELHGEFEQLESERNSLEATIQQQQHDVNSLERQLEDAQQQIQSYDELRGYLELWKSADFMLVNPGKVAVGLKQTGDGKFLMTAKGSGKQSQIARLLGQQLAIPQLQHVAHTTGAVAREVEINQALPTHLANQVGQHWKQHRYVPADPHDSAATFLTFWDTRAKRFRTGFYASHDDERVTFHSLSQHSETIPRSQIAPGTARIGLADDVQQDQHADALEFALLKTAQELGSLNAAGYRAVSLSVDVDELKEVLSYSRREDDSWIDDMFDLYARSRHESFRTDTRKTAARELRRLRDEIYDEVTAGLNKLGIRVLEREHLASIREERALADAADFADPDYANMEAASHLIKIDVGRPTNGGVHRLSFRVIAVNSATTLWAFNGDRFNPERRQRASFMLGSGQVIKLPRTSSRPERLYAADHVGNGKWSVRQLMDNKATLVDAEKLRSSSAVAVEKIDHVSLQTRLQYVLYQLTLAVRPIAGRVTKLENGTAVLNIGKRHGIAPDDRFRVVRASADTYGSMSTGMAMSTLPMELEVSELFDGQTRVAVSETGLRGLWGDGTYLREGDIVVRQSSRDPLVAFEPVVYDDSLEAESVRFEKRTANQNQLKELDRKTSMTGSMLVNLLKSELERQDVAVVAQTAASVIPNSEARVREDEAVFGTMIESEENRDHKAAVHKQLPTHTVRIHIGAVTFFNKAPVFNWELDIEDNETGRIRTLPRFKLGQAQIVSL